MKPSIWLTAFLCLVGILILSDTAQPQPPTPVFIQVTPSEVKWTPFPALPAGAQIAVIYGNPFKPELYVMPMKYPPNFKLLPHFHPVEQVATVLSGTIYSGVGESFDPNKLTMFPAGSVYTEPVKTPHFSETRAEGVILQVTGVGPNAMQYVNPSDDPRKK
jgi:quercetin dioxygenase-like cupin family protein